MLGATQWRPKAQCIAQKVRRCLKLSGTTEDADGGAPKRPGSQPVFGGSGEPPGHGNTCDHWVATQLVKDADGIRLYTKTGIDWTAKYRPLAAEAAALKAANFIIEGETIVTNEAGLSDFHALRWAITRRPQDLYFVAFDLLHLNGHELRDMPLKDRREILHALIPDGGRIQFSEALPGTGDAVYHLACEAGLEGVVSKRLDSVYRSGPTMNWRKIKCFVEKEMDIIGVQREPGKPAMVLIADQGRYMGGAFVTFKVDKRQPAMGPRSG
ncbi:ATP-dependent DNA ligase [Mesorhizobium tamadayense]|uniref:ATP-dependent DNA ligase n=1 Tax=Mesorhizobium tamadayense TaxID=425306 RepID=UPI0026ADC51E